MRTEHLNQLKRKAETLRDEPGVYRMLDKDGQILYIGKSIHIRTRVMSYLRPNPKRSKKIALMVGVMRDFEVYYTDTELDALLLECRWIKQVKPSYNTVLTKQSKYVYLDFHKKGKHLVNINKDSSKVCDLRMGPFTHQRLARKAYGYMKIREDYSYETLTYAMLDQESTIEDKIKEQMLEASECLEFEKAGMYLEQLKGIKYIRLIAKVTQDALSERSIGRCTIPGTNRYKYYAIVRGGIVKTSVGYGVQEKEIVEQLKHYLVSTEEKTPYLRIDEIDECLIVQGAIHRGELHLVYKIS